MIENDGIRICVFGRVNASHATKHPTNMDDTMSMHIYWMAKGAISYICDLYTYRLLRYVAS